MGYEGYTIDDDYLYIDFDETRETKKLMNRVIEEAKQQREDISRAIEELQVPDSVLRGYGDDLIPVKNSIIKDIDELERMSSHLDYVMRRFEEVDNDFAARFRAVSYEMQETLGLERKSGLFEGLIGGLKSIISQGEKAWHWLSESLEDKGKQIEQYTKDWFKDVEHNFDTKSKLITVSAYKLFVISDNIIDEAKEMYEYVNSKYTNGVDIFYDGMDRFNEQMGENMSNYAKGLGQFITDLFTGQMAVDISEWFDANGETLSKGPIYWTEQVSDYFSVKENNPSYIIDQKIKSFINANSNGKIDMAADAFAWIIWNGVWEVATCGLASGLGSSDDIVKGLSKIDDVTDATKTVANAIETATTEARAIGIADEAQLAKVGENTAEAVSNGSKLTKPTLAEGGLPKGKYEVPDINDPRPITRQNQAADLLANKGYDIEMLPNKTDGNGYGLTPTANPDFKINGEIFDCYSPDTSSVRNIWTTVQQKTLSQTKRIVLNLDDFPGSLDDLAKQFNDWPIDSLDELLIMKNGKISRLFIR